MLKGADPSEILKVVRAVAAGEAYFGKEIARRLTDFFSAPQPASPTEPFPELTAREREVLDLIAQGHNNARIARLLFVSPKTVRNHISNIFTKLQIADRTQAILRAREAGLGRGRPFLSRAAPRSRASRLPQLPSPAPPHGHKKDAILGT